MSNFETMERGLLDTLFAIEDNLDKIIIVGGWCPYLYAKYLWRKEIPNIPTTTDIDLGVLETGSRKYDLTIYDKLSAAGLAVERIYDEEPQPIEFIYKKKELELKVEFITSFETSDDTLNRFLGSKLACNRIEAFEILLDDPAHIDVRHSSKSLRLSIPKPETFLYHKGITFVMRADEAKRDKDLAYVYFILKFCPDPKDFMEVLTRFKEHELYESFRANLKEFMADVGKPGYKMLRPFVRRWVEEKKINEEIRGVFEAILTVVE